MNTQPILPKFILNSADSTNSLEKDSPHRKNYFLNLLIPAISTGALMILSFGSNVVPSTTLKWITRIAAATLGITIYIQIKSDQDENVYLRNELAKLNLRLTDLEQNQQKTSNKRDSIISPGLSPISVHIHNANHFEIQQDSFRFTSPRKNFNALTGPNPNSPRRTRISKNLAKQFLSTPKVQNDSIEIFSTTQTIQGLDLETSNGSIKIFNTSDAIRNLDDSDEENLV